MFRCALPFALQFSIGRIQATTKISIENFVGKKMSIHL
jgi:hypothetical protein